MRILVANAFWSSPWTWTFRNGFKKLGHDVKCIGWGGSNDPDLQELGLVNDFDVSQSLYTQEELSQFDYTGRYRLDVPMINLGDKKDHHICYYHWELIDREIRRHLGDEWLPDLILIFEMSFAAWGDRPTRWKGIPTGFVVSDNRGIDEQYRKMRSSGVQFCFPNFAWTMDYYKYLGLNPLCPMPPCVDTDIFTPHPEIEAEADLVFGGGHGMDVGPRDSREAVNHPTYGWALGKWEVADYRWRAAKYIDPYWGEYGHRAEFIKALMLSRKYTVAFYSPWHKPRNWAKGLHLGRISFSPHGGLYPFLSAFNGRMVATTASARLLMISEVYGIEELYKPGEEIITFREFTHYTHHGFEWDDVRVLEDKIGYYLTHDKEREEIAQAGYRATLKKHECKVRAQQLLDAVKTNGYLN